MKVLDLLCPLEHGFEGWFASEEDFQSQQARSLVQCPLCGSPEIRKALSAPRLSLHAGPAPITEDPSAPTGQAGEQAIMQAERQQALDDAAWLRAARRIIAETEDVGQRFAAEARRMHYGEIKKRYIRGQTNAQETAELLDEGIPVMSLVLPEAVKESLQ